MKKSTVKNIQTGKIPESVGFSGKGGGFVRTLTPKEIEQQKKFTHMS